MAFGKPDILDPKFELRPIQAAIRAARQRIEIIEAAVTVLQNIGSTSQSVATLQAQVATLLASFQNVQDANEVFAGPVSGTAAVAQFRRLVWADIPLVSELPFSSGVEADALVAIELDGTMVYITLGELLASGGTSVHNFLSGLQGDGPDYYHLDATDFAALAGARITKGTDTTDDVIIDLATKGLVLKDTQGTPHYWRVTVSTLGALTTTDLGTTKP